MRCVAPPLGLVLVVAGLAGCAPRTGHVTGQVTYRGSPVRAGWVQFQPADPSRNAVTVGLDDDGRFAADLPAGEVTVTVDNREWEPQDAGIPALPPGLPLSAEARAQRSAEAAAGGRPGKAGGRSGKYVPIPPKYYEAETSGLRITVKGGPQTEAIELTD